MRYARSADAKALASSAVSPAVAIGIAVDPYALPAASIAAVGTRVRRTVVSPRGRASPSASPCAVSRACTAKAGTVNARSSAGYQSTWPLTATIGSATSDAASLGSASKIMSPRGLP